MSNTNLQSERFRRAVSCVGGTLWLTMFVLFLATSESWREQFIIISLIPLTILLSGFAYSFRMPSGISPTKNEVTFTLTDALVLIVVCRFGIAAACVVAGIEGFIASRRGGGKWSSALFSFGMITLAAGAAGIAFQQSLRFGFEVSDVTLETSLLAVTVSFFAASLAQITVNSVLLSTVHALRRNVSLYSCWRETALYFVPLFLPTSTAATLLHVALNHNILTAAVIALPIFITIGFLFRQQRNRVHEQVSILAKAHHETIEALAVTINAKDEVTHEHVSRVQTYAAGVARLLACTDEEVEALKAGALLHDIGKIAVPDYILNKPGKLTAQEFEKMKLHTVVGAQILSRVEFPYPVVPIVRSHHERWDGKGYPDGLAGQDIPLTARILSVVDCFDAVREDRQYRRAMTRDEAVQLIKDGEGTQYDPRVVKAFVDNLATFEAEIASHRQEPSAIFRIEPCEELSETARQVAPAAGLADSTGDTTTTTAADGNNTTAEVALNHAQLDALYNFARKLSVTLPSEAETLNLLTESLLKIVPFDLCTVTLPSSVSSEKRIAHIAFGGENNRTKVTDDALLMLRGRIIGVGEGITGWVIANRRSFANVNPQLDLPTDAPPALLEAFSGFRSVAAQPLIHDAQVFGAITLYSASLTKYTAQHEQLISELATLFAATLNARQQFVQSELKPNPNPEKSDIENGSASSSSSSEIYNSSSGNFESALMH